LILLVSAIAETEYRHIAETESEAKILGLFLAVRIAETEYLNLIPDMQLLKLLMTGKWNISFYSAWDSNSQMQL